MKRAVLFGGTVLVVAVLAAFADVGWAEMLRDVAAADPRYVGVGLAASLVAQLAWGTAFARLVGAGAPNRVRLGYLAGTFVKQVVPYGHVGGPALVTYLLAADLDLEYRPTFASVVAAELVVFGASLCTAGLGLAMVAAAALSDSPLVRAAVAAGGLVLLVVAAAGAAALIDERRAVTRLLFGAAALGRWTFGRALGRVGRALAPDAVKAETDAFFGGFERATGDRGTLLRAAGYALLGWLLLSATLAAALLAVGEPVPPGLVLFLVPASGLATLLPTPGGLGGTEVGLTAAFVVLAGTDVESAAAAVLVFRACTYWFVVALGAASSLYLSANVGAATRYARPGDQR